MKTVFLCNNCGNESPKWYGRCPACGEWNTYEEISAQDETKGEAKLSSRKAHKQYGEAPSPQARKLEQIEISNSLRFSTGIGEFDRVLGGGLVEGSVVLLSGAPGIGKSTLLLQICEYLGAKHNLLYVTGEESPAQIKLRASRVGVGSKNLLVLSETNVNKIIPEINSAHPDVVIIDSIQTIYDDDYPSSPGSVTQVKQSALRLINKAKEDCVTIVIVGHVNKDGAIAGPKVLEHMVDAVLYFEGDKQQSYRIIRAVKNRYGSTNEIGVFEMNDDGLTEIENPSGVLLEQRPKGVSGSCAVCIMEGTRPIIAEIQALCTPSIYPSPRRNSSGLDYSRIALLLAVIEKRLGYKFSTLDVYMNVAAGLSINDTSCDAACILALISCYKNINIPEDLLVIGEIGLSGECRSVFSIEQRINEAARLGFKRIAIPFRAVSKIKKHPGVELLSLHSVFDLVRLLANDQ